MAVIPTVDRNGNTWSDEQMDVLEAFAEGLDAYTQDGTPFSIAIDAVAGSGKTSLLQGMCHITAHLAPQLLTAMTAFNTHIAKSSMEILLEFKTKTGLNVKILGGSNTVNAGGMGMITSKARSEGYSRVVLTDYGNDRYARIARITLSGWLAREDRLSLLEQVQEVTQEKTTSHTFNNLIGELVGVATMAMDEGYVPRNTVRDEDQIPTDYIPPTVHSDDIAALIEVIDKVGVNQGWSENNARNLGDQSVYQLVVEILAVAIETAYMKVELQPYCQYPLKAIVPNKDGNGWWSNAKALGQCIYTNDPTKQKKAQFSVLETAGCRWPPAEKKENSISAKSFNTEAKCIVKEYSGHTIMSFENGGHTKRLGGKAIGTQFGFNGNYSVNGERISSWRKFNSNLGVTVINPKDLKKVIKLLSDTFGDEFDNQLEGDVTVDDVETVTSNGVCYLSMKDQIYLPHALDLQIAEHEKADVVFIDEVQDLSILKAELVWRLVKEDAIKVIVGDFKQAIYAFCGADNDAFKTNAERIGATFYPNTICWRGTAMVAASARVACKKFVGIAKSQWGEDMDVPDYQAHRSPLEAGYDWPKGALPAQITADEVVTAYHESRRLHGDDVTFGLLCRVKRPLASFIKIFLKNGIPVSTPSGKDGIVKQAFTLANRAQSNTTTRNVNAKSRLGLGWKDMPVASRGGMLISQINDMKDLLRAKYTDMFKGDTQAMAQSTEYQEMQGDLELLEAFVMLWNDSGDGLTGKNLSDGLMNWVNDTLFSERGGNAVHIATIHRYKGDEADIMFVVNSMLNDSEDPDAPKTIDCFMNKRSLEASKESAINEINMGYVAFTRAKKQNIIINAELEGVGCSDVKKRLEAYYNADWGALMGETPSEPQPKPGLDSEGDSEDSERTHLWHKDTYPNEVTWGDYLKFLKTDQKEIVDAENFDFENKIKLARPGPSRIHHAYNLKTGWGMSKKAWNAATCTNVCSNNPESNQPTLCKCCNAVMHMFSEFEEAGLYHHHVLVGELNDNPYPHCRRTDETALLEFVGGRKLRLSIEAFYVAQDEYLGEIDSEGEATYRELFSQITHQQGSRGEIGVFWLSDMYGGGKA